jgi:hypothetical protein
MTKQPDHLSPSEKMVNTEGIVEWEKEFNLMWERDFSEPSKGNPDQWIMLSPIKYKDFISKALQSQADKTREEVLGELKMEQMDGYDFRLDFGGGFDKHEINDWLSAYNQAVREINDKINKLKKK